MGYQGVIIGASAFFIIGVFHPIVIKTEFYIGKKAWPVFLITGIVLVAWSLFIDSLTASAIISITGFSSLWSIHELIEQEERVKKGWFPANPDRKR